MDELIPKYIKTLTIYEKTALNIASDHLQSSFSIKTSIGFKQFLKDKNN